MSRHTAGPPRVAVLGAGPVGVEAALYAASLKLPVRVYERDEVGANLRHWGHVRMFTPFGTNVTPLGRAALRADAPRRDLPADGDLLTGREHLAAYLEPLAAGSLLAGAVAAGTSVLAVGRKGCLKEEHAGDPARRRAQQQPFRLLLRGPDGRERVEEADVVLDCTGTYGSPRHLGDGGIPAVGELALRDRIAWGLEDVLGERRAHYADRTTLVIGAGHTAASTVTLLAKLAEGAASTWVVWLARRAGSQPIRRVLNDPLRERDHLAARANNLATRGEGHVEFFAQAVVQSVEEDEGGEGLVVRALVGGEERHWQVERLIANVGYEPDGSLYRALQVHEGEAPPGAERNNPEPNFFVLGSKGHGRQQTFLLRTGFEQVREAFGLIAGRADLDLYRKGR
jgi:thioredoxin reductase